MEEVRHLKRITPAELKKKLSAANVMCIVGVLLFLVSIGICVLCNLDRYGGNGVTAVQVAAKVTGSESVFEEQDQDGASIVQERWYLTAEYQLAGQTHEVQLNDYFVDKSYVARHVGETRELYVDVKTYEPLEQRPFSLWFLIPMAAGLIVTVSGILIRFRYTDYKYRLLPGKKKVIHTRNQAFVMKRGSL